MENRRRHHYEGIAEKCLHIKELLASTAPANGMEPRMLYCLLVYKLVQARMPAEPTRAIMIRVNSSKVGAANARTQSPFHPIRLFRRCRKITFPLRR